MIAIGGRCVCTDTGRQKAGGQAGRRAGVTIHSRCIAYGPHFHRCTLCLRFAVDARRIPEQTTCQRVAAMQGARSLSHGRRSSTDRHSRVLYRLSSLQSPRAGILSAPKSTAESRTDCGSGHLLSLLLTVYNSEGKLQTALVVCRRLSLFIASCFESSILCHGVAAAQALRLS